MPMSGELCDRLELEQMVTNNTDNHCTAFTVSIDHVDTTTGISAAERFLYRPQVSGGWGKTHRFPQAGAYVSAPGEGGRRTGA